MYLNSADYKHYGSLGINGGCKHIQTRRVLQGEYGEMDVVLNALSLSFKYREQGKPAKTKDMVLYQGAWAQQRAWLLNGAVSMGTSAAAPPPPPPLPTAASSSFSAPSSSFSSASPVFTATIGAGVDISSMITCVKKSDGLYIVRLLQKPTIEFTALGGSVIRRSFMTGDIIDQIDGTLPVDVALLGPSSSVRTLRVRGVPTKGLAVMKAGQRRVLGLEKGAREPGGGRARFRKAGMTIAQRSDEFRPDDLRKKPTAGARSLQPQRKRKKTSAKSHACSETLQALAGGAGGGCVTEGPGAVGGAGAGVATVPPPPPQPKRQRKPNSRYLSGA